MPTSAFPTPRLGDSGTLTKQQDSLRHWIEPCCRIDEAGRRHRDARWGDWLAGRQLSPSLAVPLPRVRIELAAGTAAVNENHLMYWVIGRRHAFTPGRALGGTQLRPAARTRSPNPCVAQDSTQAISAT